MLRFPKYLHPVQASQEFVPPSLEHCCHHHKNEMLFDSTWYFLLGHSMKIVLGI